MQTYIHVFRTYMYVRSKCSKVQGDHAAVLTLEMTSYCRLSFAQMLSIFKVHIEILRTHLHWSGRRNLCYLRFPMIRMISVGRTFYMQMLKAIGLQFRNRILNDFWFSYLTARSNKQHNITWSYIEFIFRKEESKILEWKIPPA